MTSTESPTVPDVEVTRHEEKGLLSLSNDILLGVIQYCLADDSESVEIPPNSHSQHLILCHICHTLRSIILASPGLWTKFTLTTTRLGQHRDLYQEWLSRAEDQGGSYPISMENREESTFSIAELNELVLPYSDRLLRVHLYLTYEALERLFNLVPPIPFPRLANFSVICSDFHQPSLLDVEPLFRGSPVKEFAIDLGPPVLVRGLGISWARLKVLRLIASRARFYFPISWIHAIFVACGASLESCSISLEPTTDPDLPRISLPSLRDLTIHFRDPGWKTQAGFFGFLSLPSLISLELKSPDGLAFNEVCSALKSFFHRSPNIQQLRFARTVAPGSGFSSTVNSTEVVNILTLLPRLRVLELPKGPHTNIMPVLEAILLKGVCTDLEALEMVVNNGIQAVRVIQVLWNESAAMAGEERSLSKITIIDPKSWWTSDGEPSLAEESEVAACRQILREMRDAGLVITLSNSLDTDS
ncbi:hypothetical protein NP233_g7251 [Leucocoprinus birnbaumii]|uniref:F-box domain-containing protein n=1 Tax=Leucocoprinus birnbaumii TaxID=56174 RepID=A0AAD5VSW0_9AGAR|nr:hypothetical protein NP233_g7251 [Leucocoprinus birnbaumii]